MMKVLVMRAVWFCPDTKNDIKNTRYPITIFNPKPNNMICHPEAAAYQHHYTALDEQRRRAFDTFKQSFPGLPMVFSNCLTYTSIAGSQANHAAQAAAHIKLLRLPLSVQPLASGGQYGFRIQFVEEMEVLAY